MGRRSEERERKFVQPWVGSTLTTTSWSSSSSKGQPFFFWPFQPCAQAAKIGVLWRVSARFSLQSSNLQYNIVVVVCFKSPFLYIGTITQHCSTFHL